MKLPNSLDRFFNDHSGALSAEWAILTASALALVLVVLTSLPAQNHTAQEPPITEPTSLSAG